MAKMFKKLMKGLEEVKEIVKEERVPARASRKRLRIPAPSNLTAAEIRAIRTKDGCSQESFAQLLAISVDLSMSFNAMKRSPTV